MVKADQLAGIYHDEDGDGQDAPRQTGKAEDGDVSAARVAEAV